MPRLGQGGAPPVRTADAIPVADAGATGADEELYDARVMVIRAAGSGQS
jgi:hypothetical protein